jgi:hypothetical protein
MAPVAVLCGHEGIHIENLHIKKAPTEMRVGALILGIRGQLIPGGVRTSTCPLPLQLRFKDRPYLAIVGLLSSGLVPWQNAQNARGRAH